MNERIRNEAEAELRRNIIAYHAMEAEWEQKNRGKFAIFCNGKLKRICENSDEAYDYARNNLEIGKFAIKEIGSHPVHYGAMNGMLDTIDLDTAA